MSRAIFVGEVVEVKPIEDGKNAIKFRVERYWRGVRASNMTVISSRPVLCTGLPDKVGEKYLVFAISYQR